jgi:hypothetical protein
VLAVAYVPGQARGAGGRFFLHDGLGARPGQRGETAVWQDRSGTCRPMGEALAHAHTLKSARTRHGAAATPLDVVRTPGGTIMTERHHRVLVGSRKTVVQPVQPAPPLSQGRMARHQGALAACQESAPAQSVLAADGGGRLALEPGQDGLQALDLLRPSGCCRVVLAPADPPAVGARPRTVQVRYTSPGHFLPLRTLLAVA